MTTTARRPPQTKSKDPKLKLLDAYKRHLEASGGLSPATVRNYVADLAPFIEYLAREEVPLGANAADLRRLVERDGKSGVNGAYRRIVRDYISWLMEGRELHSGRRAGSKGHARASVLRSLVALRTFMRYLIDNGRLPGAPLWEPRSTAMRRFTPKPAKRLPDVVSTAEAVTLVEAPRAASDAPPKQRAAALRDRAVLELLYGSGLRVSEAVGLDLGDVSLDSKTARVLGKGSKARQVPLSGPCVAAIRGYLKDGRPALETQTSAVSLFVGARGGRLSVRAVQSMVERYSSQSGIGPGVHPHTLRHSFATHLLDGGADLRVVQELLGHSTPSATQVYTHISQTEARKAYLSAHPLAH